MINILEFNNKIYKYESFWRKDKNFKTRDSRDKILPYPRPGKKWNNQELFLVKLAELQNYILKNMKHKFTKYKKNKNCLICKAKNITTGLFTLTNMRWEDGLYHYIKVHNIKPSDEFIDFIFSFDVDPKIIKKIKTSRIKGKEIVIKNKKYLKIYRNQILIMDALMEHGSKKLYHQNTKSNDYKYSEHAGLLDFDDIGLERVIVYGNTNRVDKYDNEIYQPNNIPDMFDYEYIFHTHPPTPKIGSRVKHGILYEFPSISDLFHFIDHYNDGDTQGSFVVAPEGMYLIRKLDFDRKKIILNEDKFYNAMYDIYFKVQNEAIKKYGNKFSNQYFYNTIAQNKTYINKINNVLNKFGVQIDYYPRVNIEGQKWIIDNIYIPIYVVEPK